MSEPLKGRIVFLDYMRVFAFVSVLIGHKFFENIVHLATDSTQHITVRYLAELLIPLCQGGAAGVVVFFMTSGYIITHVLQKEEPGDFLIKRFFRIYPLFIFAVIAELIFGYVVHDVPVPSLQVIIPRIFLLGDFFGTPYGLAGVEWTLRIEVMFYLFMFALKMLGVFRKQNVLPIIYVVVAAVLYLMPTFPSGYGWSDGYFNLYTPFLLVGSCIYLAQQKTIKKTTCFTVCTLMFFAFMSLITTLHPNWKDSHYALFAVLLFLGAIIWQAKLHDSYVLGLLSNLTYSVYLFHNWLWDYIAIPVLSLGFTGLNAKLVIGAVLLAVCYALHATIETYGLTLGSKVLKIRRNMKERQREDKKSIALLYNWVAGLKRGN
ncbi:acyltransferase family protein [Pseudomonas frederiksbergensis]|uniref:acyltransferase family protein n=1 Tax=Pseudomonas frederiksbergensis TaxID=104087 RepID=UPI003D2403DB